MANFVYVLGRGMDMCPGSKDESKVPEAERIGQEVDLEKRVELLIESTCYMVFAYVAQGLFERHKLIVATQWQYKGYKGKRPQSRRLTASHGSLLSLSLSATTLFQLCKPRPGHLATCVAAPACVGIGGRPRKPTGQEDLPFERCTYVKAACNRDWESKGTGCESM
eukprot:1161047-Pelagomonas_calceolata.AAC.50